MNLLYGEIVALFAEDGVLMGKIRVGGALKTMPVALIGGAHRGDRVLVCDGVAISKVDVNVSEPKPREERFYVSSHSRKSH